MALLFSSCAHSVKNRLAGMRVGMTQSELIDEVGSPTRVNRNSSDKHIWVYRYFDDEKSNWVEKEVHLKSGMISYIGTVNKNRDTVLSNKGKDTKTDVYKLVTEENKKENVEMYTSQELQEEYNQKQLESEKAKTLERFRPIK